MSLVPGKPDASVEVVPYSKMWPVLFEQERAALQAAVGDMARSIEHIGSTAVPGLSAKPTIDILLVVDSTEEFLKRLPRVEALGYDYRADNTFVGSETHLFLRKVSNGSRTHHLHVLRSGSPEIDDYRLLRDALRDSPALAREYQRLKLVLAAEYAGDRNRYVTGKASWVDGIVASLRERRAELETRARSNPRRASGHTAPAEPFSCSPGRRAGTRQAVVL